MHVGVAARGSLDARGVVARSWPTRSDLALPALIGSSWLALVVLDATGAAAALHHHALIEGGPPLSVAIPSFLIAWTLMVVAMMMPGSVPATRIATRPAGLVARASHSELAFVAGFVAVWAAFGLAAFLGDMVVHRIVDATAWLGARPWLIEAGMLLVAGGYQVTARKQRDLARCRHPSEPPSGVAGSLLQAARLGMDHGLACLGASWALMLLMFGEGFTGLPWMVGLTAVMVVEAGGERPRRFSVIVGIGLILLALMVLGGPAVT